MAKVTEFYEAAIVLTNAEMVDAMMRLWLGFHSDNEWVAALSAEERADFLNFPDSVQHTVLSDSNNPDQHTGPNWDQEDTELEPIEEGPIEVTLMNGTQLWLNTDGSVETLNSLIDPRPQFEANLKMQAELFDEGMNEILDKRMRFGLIYGAGPASLANMMTQFCTVCGTHHTGPQCPTMYCQDCQCEHAIGGCGTEV